MYYAIKSQLISEKVSVAETEGFYAFIVDKNATKSMLKKEIEAVFDVQVDSIRTLNCRSRSSNTKMGFRPIQSWKKAYVKLKSGQKISLLEGA
jgi:large subunit ribosomal protein L23